MLALLAVAGTLVVAAAMRAAVLMVLVMGSCADGRYSGSGWPSDGWVNGACAGDGGCCGVGGLQAGGCYLSSKELSAIESSKLSYKHV